MAGLRAMEGGSARTAFTALVAVAAAVVAIAAGAVLATVAAAPAYAAATGCTTGLYYATGSTHIQVLQPDGTEVAIGTGAVSFETIAFDPVDGYLYGLIAGSTNHIYRIAADGSSTDLGAPAGLASGLHVSATFDDAGNLWIGGGSTLSRVDVGAMTSTTLSLTGGSTSGDLVYMDGVMYSGGSSHIDTIDLATGAVTVGGSFPAVFGGGGGLWGASGHLYINNKIRVISEVFGAATASPTLVQVATPVSNPFDGASCASAASPFLAAADDDFTDQPLTSAGGATATVFTNDTNNGATPLPADVTPTLTSDGGLTGAVINADGTITVPADANAGTYHLEYTICRTADPLICDPAGVTLRVSPPGATTGSGTAALPATGVDATPGLVTGLGLLLAGVGAAAAARARRRRVSWKDRPAGGPLSDPAP